jgi:hypothetical protein
VTDDETERDLYRPPKHGDVQKARNLQHIKEAREVLLSATQRMTKRTAPLRRPPPASPGYVTDETGPSEG